MLTSCVEPVTEMFGSIYGIVSDEETGEPVRNASVALSPDNLTTVTGSDGRFEFTDLEPGQHRIQVKAKGYNTNSKLVSVVAGGKATGDIILTPEKEEASFELSTEQIDFDTEYTELSFDITNTGNAGTLSWNITDVDADWLSVTPTSGKTEVGKTSSVKVKADRAKVSKKETVCFNVNAAGGSKSVTVTIDVKPKDAYVEIEPSATIDFGLTETTKNIVMTSHYDSSDYTAKIESCDGGWLTLSHDSGTIPDYETTQRNEKISLTVDRDKMNGKKETCTLVITSRDQVHNIKVTAEKEIVDFALESTSVKLHRGDLYQIKGNKEITNCSVDNKYSVTVSPTGYVEAERIGTAVITVNSGSEMAKMEVVVEPESELYYDPSFALGYTEEDITYVFGNDPIKGENYLYYPVYNSCSEIMFLMNSKGECYYVCLYIPQSYQEEVKTYLYERYVDINKGNAHDTYFIDALTADKANLLINLSTDDPEYLSVGYSVYGADNSGDDNSGDEGGNNPDDGGDDTTDKLVVPQGLYTYYKFEGDYNDATENAVNGFGKNNPKFVDGVTTGTKAVKFSRTDNSYFNVPSPIIDSKEFSVSLWGKGFSDGNIFYMQNTDNEPILSLTMKDGSLRFLVSRYNNWAYDLSYTVGVGYFSHPDLNDDKWHHIVITMDYSKTAYSKATTKLYVDGNLVDVISEETNASDTFGHGLKFVMGGSLSFASNSEPVKGTNMAVDNFRVYDTRQLTAQEVKDIYNAKQ